MRKYITFKKYKSEEISTEKKLNNNKNSFNLAETMIVVVVLGILAALTIPALVRRHTETANRTKFKKAMAIYESAINKMAIENNIKSNSYFYGENGFAPAGTCEHSLTYFKIFETMTGGNCRFKTSDGVFWDISNINKVIVSINAKDLNTQTADSNTNRAFYLVSEFDSSGSLRINDIAYETGEDKENLTKLYDYVFGRTTMSSEEIAVSEEDTEDTDESCDSICKYNRHDYDQSCVGDNLNSCSKCKKENGKYLCDVYDENGTRIVKKYVCTDDYSSCDRINTYYEDGVTMKSIKNPLYEINNILYVEDSYCDPVKKGYVVTRANNAACWGAAQCTGQICNIFDEEGQRTIKLSSCHQYNGIIYYDDCKSMAIYDSEGNKITEKKNCNTSTGQCNSCTGVCD